MAVTQETREGTIDALYGGPFGAVKDSLNDEVGDFDQPGADVDFQTGEGITFLRIGLPNGKTLIKQIKKKPK